MQCKLNTSTLYEGTYNNEFFPQKLRIYFAFTLLKTSVIPTDLSVVTIQYQKITYECVTKSIQNAVLQDPWYGDHSRSLPTNLYSITNIDTLF